MKTRILMISALALLLSCGGRKQSSVAESVAPQPGEPEENSLAPETDGAESDSTTRSTLIDDDSLFDIVTNLGTIRIRLYDDTPLHKYNFIDLVEKKFYDGVLFHRVINGFMIQTGDPLTKDPERMHEWGEGGPGYTIPAEILPQHSHIKGAVAAARRGDEANPYRESSGSQFYIVQDPEHCRHLDGAYTVFGETVSGLDVIDRIARVQTLRNDRPVEDVKITRITAISSKNEAP